MSDTKPNLGQRLAAIGDSVISVFSPVAANNRRKARMEMEFRQRRHDLRMARLSADDDDWRGWGGGGFGSVERSRDAHTWLTSRLSPDAALELDLEEMRARSNSAYKNYELFAGHVERRVNRVAGTGIMLAPRILPAAGKIADDQAVEWNRILRESFERWAHKAGGHNLPLYVIERQIVRHIEKDGVAFVQFGDVIQSDPRVPVSLRIKVVHPRRVETPPKFAGDPNVRLGIRTNPDTNDVLGYYVRTAHPGDSKNFEYKHDYIEAAFENGLPRMVYIGQPREADQTISYPQGQVMLKRCKNTEEYEEADLERNIIAACYAGFAIGGDPTNMAASAASGTDSRGRLVEELSPGRISYVPNDVEKLEFSNPHGPQAAFTPYVEHQNRMAAAGACSSYEMMSGDWRGLTYSGGKIIWVDEQGVIDVGQLDLIEMFLVPLWQNFVNRCATTNIIDVSQASYRREPWLYEAVKFVPPKRQSIDPARERRAAHSDIAAGIVLHSDEVEQINGRPAEDVYEEIKRNKVVLEEIGVPIPMPGLGGTQPGDDNPATEEGSAGEEKRKEVGAGA